MPLLRELLPSALICVDERERDQYSGVVPPAQLLLHRPMEIAATVRNWIVDTLTTPIVVMIDDDFCGVQVTTGSRRFITDPEEIMAIIENAARCCADLELGCFCFAGTPNATVTRPDDRPIEKYAASGPLADQCQISTRLSCKIMDAEMPLCERFGYD